MTSRENQWRNYFLRLAREASTMSRDPSTRVGAVIVDPLKRIVATGFNGFGRGMSDDPSLYADREVKLSRVIHAETNALLNATGPVRGCSLYVWPLAPCPACSLLIIQSGIVSVTAPSGHPSAERWAAELRKSANFFAEAGVPVDLVPITTLDQETTTP